MDPAFRIQYYRHIAEDAIEHIPKEHRSPEDQKIYSILNTQIKKLSNEENNILAAQKADTAFIKFLKFLRWVTTPLWIIPYTFIRLFVKEKSLEERIQQIFDKIFSCLTEEQKRLLVIQELKAYQGEKLPSDTDAISFREMMCGIRSSIKLDTVRSPSGTVQIPHQFERELVGTPTVKIGEELMQAPDQPGDHVVIYQTLEQLVGKGLRVLLNAAHQGVASSLSKHLVAMSQQIEAKGLSGFLPLGQVNAAQKAGIDVRSVAQRISLFKDKEDNVHFIYQTPYILSNPEWGDKSDLGLIFASQEIVIPKSELESFDKDFQAKEQELQEAIEQSLAGQQLTAEKLEAARIKADEKLRPEKFDDLVVKGAPNLQAFNSFSKVISLDQGIVAAYKKGLEDLKAQEGREV